MTRSRLLAGIAIAAAIAAFFAFDAGRLLSFDYLRAQQAAIESWRAGNPVIAAGAYFAIYVAVTGLSLPGATVLTLAGAAVFGLGQGTLIVSFASSIGATLAFLASRWLFRDALRRRFGARMRAIDEGFRREGAFYLFALRLVPAFPFFAINLAMGLTAMRVWTFYWVSQLGMLPGTIVYVNAGSQLAQIESLSGLLSPGLIASFAALGVFPLLARRALAMLRTRRALARWPRPERFDRNLVVIGAGAGGLVAAYVAAAVKARVTLVERHRMGGDCLNTGCVPSKALIRTARLAAQIRRAGEFGLRAGAPEVAFDQVMERVRGVVRAVEPHDSVERYSALGVECVHGDARITSPWTVEIRAEGSAPRTLSTRAIVVAAGARPLVPPIPGLAETGFLTSNTVWELRQLPRRLVVLGGGPIGSELAQCFARLGSQVTLVEMAPRILTREDPEVSAMVAARFEREGIRLLLGHRAVRALREDGATVLVCERDGAEVRVSCDELLCALGRSANSAGYGLEELGVSLRRDGTIETDEFMRTSVPTVFACGDVAGPWQFTHTASHQAWYAAVNALAGGWWRVRVDTSAIPWATFTEPEVARVGLNESEAREQGVAFEVTTHDTADLDRAIADGESCGLVKVLTVPGSDRILGATIVGAQAGERITEFVGAMKNGIGLNRILGTIHIYPTLSEANRYAAGNWKRAHAPVRLLAWAERFHAWRRGA